MIDFLLGVPGKLKTISDYLTTYLSSTRAAKIDNLDATVSSRAAASTALTNATWSDARAGKLDAVIQTSVIQSIQTGVFAGNLTNSGSNNEDRSYTDITINAVVVGKCFVFCSGGAMDIAPMPVLGVTYSCRLTSTTKLRISSINSSVHNFVHWTVVEFK